MMAKKPRPYLLKERNEEQNKLILEIQEDDNRPFMGISLAHWMELSPRSARAMAKRLIAMADYIESRKE